MTIRLLAHRRRMYRRLTPLWTALHEASPEDSLHRTPAGGWRDALRVRGTHRRYYQLAIECRDGLVRLSPYLAEMEAPMEPSAPLPPGRRLSTRTSSPACPPLNSASTSATCLRCFLPPCRPHLPTMRSGSAGRAAAPATRSPSPLYRGAPVATTTCTFRSRCWRAGSSRRTVTWTPRRFCAASTWPSFSTAPRTAACGTARRSPNAPCRRASVSSSDMAWPRTVGSGASSTSRAPAMPSCPPRSSLCSSR